MSTRLQNIALLSIRRSDGRNSHTRVTAGLAAALRRGFPAAAMALWAGDEDFREIASRLEASTIGVGPLVHHAVDLESQWTSVPGLGRPKHALWLARRMAAVRRTAPDLTVLADYGTRDLLRWKQLERAGLRLPAVLVVLHGGIEPAGSAARAALPAAADYRAAIEWPSSPALHYLALAPSAAATLAAEMPSLAGRLHAIDIPDLGCEAPVGPPAWRPPARLRVGFVGGTWGRKGFRRFAALAGAVAARAPQVDFVLVGDAQREAAGYAPAEWRELAARIEGLDRERLDARTYEEECSRLTYLAFLGDPESYSRQASLTVVDAFRHAVPVLGLDSPLLRDLEARVGPFGRLFGSPDDAAEFLVGAARAFPLAEWERQREALLRGRAMFTPAAAAPRLAAAIARIVGAPAPTATS